jgi:oligopeptide/dipeptide ABC transporter ATP-binding protein
MPAPADRAIAPMEIRAEKRRSVGARMLELAIRDRFALAGILIYIVFIVVALFADRLATHDPLEILFRANGRVAANQPPGELYLLGTTNLGRDVYSQVIWGARSALIVGLSAAVIVVVVGTIVGLLGGYFGGWIDTVLMRVADIALAIPFLPFVIVLTAFLRPSTTNVVIAVALLLWANTARVVRSQVLTVRERAYIEAARVTGASDLRIIFVHVAPNILPISFLYGSIVVGWAIFAEATVSFIGLGADRQRVVGLHAAGRLREPGAVARQLSLVRAARHLHHADRRRRVLHQPRLRRAALPQAAGLSDGRDPRSRRPARPLPHQPGHDPRRRRRQLRRARGLGGRAGRRVRLRQDDGGACDHRRDGAQRLDPVGRAALRGPRPDEAPGRRLREPALAGDRLRAAKRDELARPGLSRRHPARGGADRPRRRGRARARARSAELFELVGLDPNRLRDYPHQFSGGMRQRAAIALALALEPKLVIADEPVTALDVIVQRQVLDVVRDLQAKLRLSMILVTHDISVVAYVCDRVVVMYAGQVVESGPTAAVLEAPAHPYTMGLTNAFPDLDRSGGELVPIEGDPPDLVTPPIGCRFAARCPFALDRCHREAPPIRVIRDDQRAACWRSDEAPALRAKAAEVATWLRS